MENKSYPSIYNLQCPNCGKTELKIIGTKGSKSSSTWMFLLLGALGNLIVSSSSKSDFGLKPIQYKCLGCKKKFETLPYVAGPDELLEQPCTVTLKRLANFVGCAVSHQVFLNGEKVGNVANNSEVTFTTSVKHNTVFVADQYGVAIGESHSFTANAGETVNLKFNRKFV